MNGLAAKLLDVAVYGAEPNDDLVPLLIHARKNKILLHLLRVLNVQGSIWERQESALSVSMVLAATPLIGLTLNYMPLGTRLSTVLASLVLLTAVFVMIAIIRRR